MPELGDLIVLDVGTLRADCPSYHGYNRETSLPQDTLETDHGFSTDAIPGSPHTREALPELPTGRRPDVFASQGYGLVTESLASIPDVAGSKTAGFHSNPYVPRADGFTEGFDVCRDSVPHRNYSLLIGKAFPGDENPQIQRFATGSGNVCSRWNVDTDEIADSMRESGVGTAG